MQPFILLVVGAAVGITAQQCYSMDGSVLDGRYKPCYPQAESSACCMLNGTQGADQQNDLCLDSGLCQSTSGWYAGFLYINGCTDQSGKADGCPKLCSFLGNQYSWSVLQCEPGKFCCRAASDDENCCGKNETIISTSHIGNLLLPGASQAINTTYNATTGQSSSSSATNGSVCTSESNSTACPVDHSATVGGAVGGALGAALIGAFVALAFALRSRNHYKSDLLGTQAVLSSTEIIAAQEKANFQKQLEEHQRQMQTVPPQYPMGNGYVSPTIHGYTSNSGTYSSNFRPAPMEMPSDPNHGLNEMAEENNSRVELKGPSSDAN